MNENIVIIGAGNIGTRHLQGVLKYEEKLNIYAVEPNETARKKSQMMIEDTQKKSMNRVSYVSDVEKLPEYVDIAIVATNSAVRKKVIENLLEYVKVKYLILEKVMFPHVSYYEQIGNLLKKKGVKTWVNCVKRSWKYASVLKKYYKDNDSLQMTVSGKMWGLACNAVHYIDFLSFLTDCCEYPVIDNSMVDERIISSKREGYIEFTGQLNIRLGKHILELICDEGVFDGFYITIKDKKIECRIVEKGEYGLNIIKNIDTGKEEREKYKVEFQSNLSGKLVSELLDTGRCNLPDYELASKWHIPLIKSLSEKAGLEKDYCNIT